MNISKRISAVTIKRSTDYDGDTSHYGEYSNSDDSDLFTIDREHSQDCVINSLAHKLAFESLEHSISYLIRSAEELVGEAFDDALTILGDAQDEVTECDCNGGDKLRDEYRYFNPSSNYVDGFGRVLPENTPEEVRTYVAQDYKRMEDLHRGFWGLIGIKAEAEVVINGVIQKITSGGLWGIESDSDEDNFKQVEAEELVELRKQLEALGFSKRAISVAFKTVQHKEE